MTASPNESRVTLDIAGKADLPRFRKDLQEAFAIAAVEEFGSTGDGLVPSEEDVAASFGAPNAVVHRILEDGRWVGGAIVWASDPEDEYDETMLKGRALLQAYAALRMRSDGGARVP